MKWLPEHDKTMICLNPMADLTTISGRFTAGIMAQFGEMEADMIAERVKESYTALHAAGQYAGGLCPFGLVPVKLDGKGWGYEIDPVYGPVVLEMAERFLGGESLRMIAVWLNETGVPTSRNLARRRAGKPERASEWKAQNVRSIFESPALTGVMVADGDILRGTDGMPIQRCAPIISHDMHAQILEKLQANSDRSGPRSNSSPLRRVAFCGSCGSVMHASSVKSGGRVYKYYHCHAAAEHGQCSERKVRADDVEAKLKAMVFAEIGDDRKMTRKDVIAATDNSEEIAKTTGAIKDWEAKAVMGESADNVLRILDQLNERLVTLTKAQQPGGVSWIEDTETVRDHWDAAEAQGGLNAFLRDRGVKIFVRHNPDGSIHAEVHLADLDVLATALAEAQKPRPVEFGPGLLAV